MRLFLKYVLLILCSWSFNYSAQAQPTASVKETRAQIDSAQVLFPTDATQAFHLLDRAITTAIAHNFLMEEADAYYTLATFNYELSAYANVIEKAKRANALFTQLEQWVKLAKTEWLLANTYFERKEYQKAIKHYNQTVSLSTKNNDFTMKTKAYIRLSDCYFALNNLSAAKTYLIKAKQTANAHSLTPQESEIALKLGHLELKTNNNSAANHYYQQANSIANQTEDAAMINTSNSAMIELNTTVKTPSLFNSINTANSLFEKKKDTLNLIQNNLQKAEYLLQNNQPEAAEQTLNKNLELSESFGSLDAQQNTTQKLYGLYLSTDNVQKAAELKEKYNAVTESLLITQQQLLKNRKEEQAILEHVEDKVVILEKEKALNKKTIDLLEKEKKLNESAITQQQTLLMVFAIALFIFVIIGVIAYRNIQAKKKAHQLLYLKSLRAQMNPHFIFNSLNSVNAFIAQHDERSANKYLAKFSKLMRQVLEYSQRDFIPLSREIEILKVYVELEHQRFKDQFDYTLTIDPKINTDEIEIPPLLIQPFIENAIWHGLRYRKTKGLLEISFEKQQENLMIQVKDNGIGRQKSAELKTNNQKKHVSSAMKNASNRLTTIQSVFRKNIDFVIEDLPHHKGTVVTITVENYE